MIEIFETSRSENQVHIEITPTVKMCKQIYRQCLKMKLYGHRLKYVQVLHFYGMPAIGSRLSLYNIAAG